MHKKNKKKNKKTFTLYAPQRIKEMSKIYSNDTKVVTLPCNYTKKIGSIKASSIFFLVYSSFCIREQLKNQIFKGLSIIMRFSFTFHGKLVEKTQ